MKKINRLITNICSDNLSESKNFYTKLFDFNVEYNSDWFIQLVSTDKTMELGIIDRKNGLIPVAYQNLPKGFYITFVVDNIDELFNVAKAEKFHIIDPPKDTNYGQRRLLLQDPNGTLIDISSPIPGFNF